MYWTSANGGPINHALCVRVFTRNTQQLYNRYIYFENVYKSYHDEGMRERGCAPEMKNVTNIINFGDVSSFTKKKYEVFVVVLD